MFYFVQVFLPNFVPRTSFFSHRAACFTYLVFVGLIVLIAGREVQIKKLLLCTFFFIFLLIPPPSLKVFSLTSCSRTTSAYVISLTLKTKFYTNIKEQVEFLFVFVFIFTCYISEGEEVIGKIIPCM